MQNIIKSISRGLFCAANVIFCSMNGAIKIMLLLGLALLAACATDPIAETESGRAIWVMDGDTLNMQKSDKTWQIVRLYGVDAPEKDQAYGPEATQHLIGLIGRKRIKIQPAATDRYGRTVAKVYVGKVYVNEEMIRSGSAWWYRQYAPRDTDLAEAESEAKKGGTGLWANPDPVPPWKFRKER